MSRSEPQQQLPPRLLNDAEMIRACRERDFSRVFRLVKRAGIYPALIARRCELTPSRVGEIAQGQRVIRDMNVIERIADGLRIPGHMLGLARRGWEDESATPPAPQPSDGDLRVVPQGEDFTDPEFVCALIGSQLPQHFTSANYFGARQPLATVLHHVRTVLRLLEATNGSTHRQLLTVGSRTAEFLGWLYQDIGSIRAAAYWSDRSMEWAQEAADDPMQSYVLFRKSNQAASQQSPERAIGLARAAQRIPGLTPDLVALAAQQEAVGYALQSNPRAALAKFDEAHELAARPIAHKPTGTPDTSYCTPAYVEIQRANCWIDLGQPRRAIQLFEDEIAALPQVYRNDRSVYFARLARAYAKAGDPERGSETATKALAIVTQTGSARTLTELASVADTMEPQRDLPAVATFTERYDLVREQLADW
ncbi:tetratricopeptide repeat protein [Streptomyces sp. 184]|uniref:tetratricopeptide repeat protein n=1 Tax=Streptomyces sp. 184 TaxID=1827526 RepID=UPI003892C0D3